MLTPILRCTIGFIASALTLLLFACGGGGGSSSSPAPVPMPPPLVGPQFRTSADSPFAANCNGAPQTGVLYVNSEVEPYVAVNPANPSNLVGVWQQDRWSDGSAQGIVTGVSSDGGMTWSRMALPFSRCAGGNAGNGGDYARVSDPWVTFSPSGLAHQIALSSSGGIFQPGSISAVLASSSADGGRTWSNTTTLIRDGEQFFNDKDSITADSSDGRFVYAVWDRLAATGGGPSYFSRTVDGGLTWEPARSIYDPGIGSQTLNNQIVALPNGMVIDFFTQINAGPNNSMSSFLAVIRSADKGVTWSAPTRIADIMALGTHDPENGTPIRDGANLGHVTVSPAGEIFVVWQDARFSNGVRDGVALSRSADSGVTWSMPVRVNGDLSVQAFIPTVHVRDDGTIGVTYYDLRSNTASRTTLLTDYWLARSTDGGVTWRENRVTGPFDLAIAPNAEGLFLGDYQSLTSVGPVFIPFYVQTNNGNLANRTDAFATLANALTNASTQDAARKRALDVTARQRIADAEATLPARIAETAAAPAMTPELRQRLNDSIVRTMQRRVPG